MSRTRISRALPLALALSGLGGGVARADEPALADEPTPADQLASRAQLPSGDWRHLGTVRAHGFTIDRYALWIGDARVDGADAVVRSRADGAFDLVEVRGLVEDGASSGLRASHEAGRAEAARLVRQTPVGFEVVRAESVEALLVRRDPLDPRSALEAAWRVRIEGPSLADRAEAVVALEPLRVLRVEDLARDARGLVYARNPVSDMEATVEVELPAQSEPATLTSAHFTVRSCDVQPGGACEPIARAVPDAAGDFLLVPEPTSFEDGFAEVMAFHHASLLADQLERDHGFRWSCTLDASMRIYTNFTDVPGVAYANAAYVQGNRDSCGYLLFGQSGSSDFAYDADVVYHELGHAVTDQLAGIVGFAVDPLGMHYEPLAINEGTSDYWAATMQGDPHVGESLQGLDGVGRSAALRDLDGGLRCPSDLVGEGHFDGRIWAGALWTLRSELGAEKVDALVFATVASLGTAPGLDDAAAVAVTTAESLRTMGTLSAVEVERVRAVLDERGLLACRRITPLDDGVTRSGYSGVPLLTGGLGKGIAPVHYAFEVPADAVSVTVSLMRSTFAGRYAVHARRNRPIGLISGRVQSEDRLEVGRTAAVIFDGTSPAFVPCSTLYLAVETLDLDVDQSLFAISASVERSGDPAARCPDPAPDAGVGADASVPTDVLLGADGSPAVTGGGGCGCRAGQGASGPPAAVVSLALAALLLSRRRTRSAR